MCIRDRVSPFTGETTSQVPLDAAASSVTGADASVSGWDVSDGWMVSTTTGSSEITGLAGSTSVRSTAAAPPSSWRSTVRA